MTVYMEQESTASGYTARTDNLLHSSLSALEGHEDMACRRLARGMVCVNKG